ncbi:LysR family transcriptional regulator [Rhodovulum sp. PH10]|uniref:LysR family transcriptional regulator n=1 Tax=Rhodovulum sp. PH10 TaxID=1187851 RepID=UPI00068E9679|nr:LysR family transcriptional regulator [Rhodovulum sp. PH10]
MDLNLRHLRAFAAVVAQGSLTKAAAVCAISQPAVTQAVAKLEAQLAARLLDRTPAGVFPTAVGRRFAERVERALERLDTTCAAIAPRLTLTVTNAQLEALIAVREAGNFTLAARGMGLAQPTVHRTIARLETDAGRPLFTRDRRGVTATRAGDNLASAARLAFAELAQACMEIEEHAGRDAGQIVIGALPLSRSFGLPQAIVRFRERWPKTALKIVSGSYRELLPGLRRGDIDLIVGALRNPPPIDDIEQRPVFDDGLVVVASPAHPLAGEPRLEVAQLLHYPWVVAGHGTPTRGHFDRVVASSAETPLSIVETSSLILMREILVISDYLGFVSRRQAEAEARSGTLAVLAVALPGTSRQIGITTRAGWKPTRSQADFLAIIDRIGSLHAPGRGRDGRADEKTDAPTEDDERAPALPVG